MQFVEANGAKIPAIGLGTWELRGRTCARLVEQALKLGYRHIDTAQVYENEREVGEGLRASGVKRDEVFVTTKVWTTHFAPQRSRAVHQGEPRQAAPVRSRSAAAALAQSAGAAVGDAGRAGACQAARHGPAHRRLELHRGPDRGGGRGCARKPLVCDQVEYHPYLDQTKVLDACARHGMALVAYSPVAKGRIKNDETLARIGQAHGKTAAQVCLRWLVQQNVAAIPRTSKIERLSENIDIFDFALSDDEMRLISGWASAKGRLTDFGFAPKWD